MRARPYAAVHAALVVVALALHLIALGDRPVHHDEAQEAWIAWRLVDAGDFVYDPVWHGPLAYLLDGLVFLVAGVSDASARTASAIAGALLVGGPYFLRHRLGRGGALAAATLLLVSPSLLYYSRFSRNDLLVALLTMALIVAVDRWWRTPRRRDPAVAGALLALLFATKESASILAGLGLALLAAGTVLDRGAVLARLRAPGRAGWLAGLGVFWLVFAALFTVGGTDPDGLWRGIYEGPRYWLTQHELGRGEKPWTYVQLLVASEWAITGLAAVGTAVAWRRRDLFGLSCALAAVTLVGAYSLAGERFAWLITQPLVPLALLAGIGTQALLARRRHVALALAAFATAAMAAAALTLSFVRPEDPRDLVVSVQTSRDAEHVRDTVRELLARGATLEVDGFGGGHWPWGWWLREEPRAGFPNMELASWRPSGDLLILSEQTRLRLGPEGLRGHRGRRFVLRRSWPRERIPTDLGAWWRYLVHREPWSPIRGDVQWLYVRRSYDAGQ